MLVYNTQNYWGSGICPLSRILKLGEDMFRIMDLFRSSGEGKIDIYSVGSFRKCYPQSLDVVSSSFHNSSRWTKPRTSIILNIFHGYVQWLFPWKERDLCRSQRIARKVAMEVGKP
jgi:hypothetical protein